MKAKKILIIVAIPILAFVVLWVFDPIPISGHDTWHYRCAVCGLRRSHGVKYFLGIRTRRFEEPLYRGEDAGLYDKLIGVPHEHEWVYRARTVSRDRIRRSRTQHGDSHPLCLLLMRHALRAIRDEFKDRPPKFRQDLYFRLIGCKSREEFLDVLEKERSKHLSEKEATDL